MNGEMRSTKSGAVDPFEDYVRKNYRGMPFLSDSMKHEALIAYIEELSEKYSGEFCVAACFKPEFLRKLMYQGYLTMAIDSQMGEVLLPKLHRDRSVVRFNDVPQPHKSTIRKSKKFVFKMNTNFDEVCKGIVRQHGENWFYPRLIETFTEINHQNSTELVKMHSFEIYCDDQLVAGEVGVSMGELYTSYSGFSGMDSAGTIQMMCMAKYLQQQGLIWWDLGMHMEYKQAYGAKPIPRKDFLQIVKAHRDAPLNFPLTCDGICAKTLFDGE